MKTILPILFILLLFSCKKDEGPYRPVKLCNNLTNNNDSILKYLPGTWEWQEDRVMKRDGGFDYYTPRTQGYKDFATIVGDTIIFTRPGVEAIVCRFNIVPEKEITLWPDDEDLVLVTYELASGRRASYYRIYICQDYLVFEQSYRSDIAPDRIYKKL